MHDDAVHGCLLGCPHCADDLSHYAYCTRLARLARRFGTHVRAAIAERFFTPGEAGFAAVACSFYHTVRGDTATREGAIRLAAQRRVPELVRHLEPAMRAAAARRG